jgi:PPM family protein phosphatase
VALTIVEKASRTDVGRQRQSNEDAFLERAPLFAVADGMGGARAGEVASRLAVEAFDARHGGDGSPEQQLADVARAANREIYDLAQEDAAHAGMGTTFTAAMLTGRELAIAHVGDSRLYRFRDGELERLTDDHSLVEEFVRQGKLTPEEAELHPQRSIITRALGPEPDVEVDTHTHSARQGDVYLICSDGLTGMVSEREVADILGSSSSLDAAADGLITAANAAGGKDNITVVLFRVGSSEGDESGPDTLSGEETQAGGLSAAAVRGALADDAARSAAATGTRTAPDETMRLSAEGAAAARASVPRAPGRRPPARRLTRRARRRRIATAAVLVLVVGAIAVGLYTAGRQFWFVGTNSRGQVTLYRGVPYTLPFGIALYSEQYQSSVPAASITNQTRRGNIINHQLRSHGDAVQVIRQLESTASRP